MTKRELIEAMAEFPDNATVLICRPTTKKGTHLTLEGIADLNANGKCIQVNTVDARNIIDKVD